MSELITGLARTNSVMLTINGNDVNELPEISRPKAVNSQENNTTVVGTYGAVDPENDTVIWSLSGDDAGRFTIASGVVRFAAVPDFEDPVDADGNNE